VSDYPAQKRGGLGTITLDVSDRTGPLVAGKELLDGDELMVISAAGTATRVVGADIPVQGRATQGRRVINVGTGDRVVEVSRVAREGGEARRSPAADDSENAEAASNRKDQLDLMR
jgi:DNA gyrase subunit A